MSEVPEVAVLVKRVGYADHRNIGKDKKGFHTEVFPEGDMLLTPETKDLNSRCYFLVHGSGVISPGDIIVLRKSQEPHTWEWHPKELRPLWEIVREEDETDKV